MLTFEDLKQLRDESMDFTPTQIKPKCPRSKLFLNILQDEDSHELSMKKNSALLVKNS